MMRAREALHIAHGTGAILTASDLEVPTFCSSELLALRSRKVKITWAKVLSVPRFSRSETFDPHFEILSETFNSIDDSRQPLYQPTKQQLDHHGKLLTIFFMT
jgi:hypothetical protein